MMKLEKIKLVFIGFVVAFGMVFLMGMKGSNGNVGRYQMVANEFGVVLNDTKTGTVKLVSATGVGRQFGIPFETMKDYPNK